MNIEELNKLKIQTQIKPMLQKFLSFIKGCLENNFYRRTFLFIVLVVLLLAAWKISAKIAWEKTLDKRAEYLYQLDKQRLDFEKNCSKIKILKIHHVLSEDSIPQNKEYELIFYFFVSDVLEFAQSDMFIEILNLLEYFFDKKHLQPEKYVIFVCGEAKTISRLDFLGNGRNFKYIKLGVVNQNIYGQLFLSADRAALVITGRNSQVLWCSSPPPKVAAEYAKILEKFVSKPENSRI